MNNLIKLENGYLSLNDNSYDFVVNLMEEGTFWEYLSNLINVDTVGSKFLPSIPNEVSGGQEDILSLLKEIQSSIKQGVSVSSLTTAKQDSLTEPVQQVEEYKPKVKKKAPKLDMSDIGNLAKLMGERTKK